MLLGKREQLKVPSQREKVLLIDAGLGGKKISFDHNGKAEHVKKRLEIYFPQLKSCAGFEIFSIFQSRGNKSPLKVITLSCNDHCHVSASLKTRLSKFEAR